MLDALIVGAVAVVFFFAGLLGALWFSRFADKQAARTLAIAHKLECSECGGAVRGYEGMPPLLVCGRCCASKLGHAPGCPVDPSRN